MLLSLTTADKIHRKALVRMRKKLLENKASRDKKLNICLSAVFPFNLKATSVSKVVFINGHYIQTKPHWKNHIQGFSNFALYYI